MRFFAARAFHADAANTAWFQQSLKLVQVFQIVHHQLALFSGEWWDLLVSVEFAGRISLTLKWIKRAQLGKQIASDLFFSSAAFFGVMLHAYSVDPAP